MRKSLSAILLVGVFAASPALATIQATKSEKKEPGTTVNKDQIVARIQKYREEGERKLVDNKFTRKEIALSGDNINESIRQKWEKMHAYYEGSKLVRIQLYPRPGSQRTEEFYLMDNKLVFAFIQDKGPKHEGKDAGEPGKELYFDNDRLIRFDDRSGEPAPNVEKEKKMYETRLPYEISQLLEILKKS